MREYIYAGNKDNIEDKHSSHIKYYKKTSKNMREGEHALTEK